MKTRKQKKYCCENCDKKTLQTEYSEGFGGEQYYLDYMCDECGSINSFPTKRPEVLTQFYFKG